MKVIRQVGNLKLNEGNLMASSLFNVSDDELLTSTKDKGVSNWFCDEVRDDLLSVSDERFVKLAKRLIEIS